jgi:RNA polymerase sigma-70 factor, ECF subfamily
VVLTAAVLSTTRDFDLAQRVTRVFVTSSTADAAMERYARGDDGAFAEVYDTIAPRLFAFLVRQTQSEARAKDILQQTLLKMHLARGSFIAGAAVLPWAYAIARRLWIDQTRRRHAEVALDAEPLADGAPQPDDAASSHELGARIRAELEKLPENQRVAFQLIKEEELSVAEAAEVLGTTESAVKLRAHRAYQKLRAALGDLVDGSAAAGDAPDETKGAPS